MIVRFNIGIQKNRCMAKFNFLKEILFIGLFILLIAACSEKKECPAGMEDCDANGHSICVPKGMC
jgi:hypothetical protein